MSLLGAARKDHQVATALHEAGHAVTYLCIGRTFEYLSLAEAQFVGNGQVMDAWDRAVTAMAGPAAEPIMHHSGRGGDADVYGWIVDQLHQRQEFVESKPGVEPDDYIHAGPYADAALPAALAIVTSSWVDVERIAAAALNTERLTYDEVLRLTAGERSLADAVSRWQAVADQG